MKQRDGFGIRGGVLGIDTQETGETIAISNLLFQFIIGQVIQMLEHQRLEHQDNVKWLSAGVTFAIFGTNSFESGSKILLVNQLIEINQRITFI